MIGHGIPEKELSVGFISGKYCFPTGTTSMVLTVEKFGENQDLVKNTRVTFEYKTVESSGSEDELVNASTGFCEIPAGELYASIFLTRKAGPPSQPEKLNGDYQAKASASEPARNFFYVELAQ